MYKVLIADDEMVVRVGLKSFVDWESLGYVYAGEAVNGEEALGLCRSIKPDVVLTDLKMPKMDGIKFVTALLQEQPDVKIVILSCVDEFDILQQALRLGVKDYFLKLSFSPEQLAVILKKIKSELDAKSKNATDALEKLSSFRDESAAKENLYKSLIAEQADKAPISAYSKKAFMLLISKDLRYEGRMLKLPGNTAQKLPIISLINDILSREFLCDVVEIKTDLFMAVCESEKEYELGKIYANALEIQNNLLRIMNYGVTVAANLCGNCIDDFYNTYQHCMTALQQKFYEGHQSIIFYDKEMDPPKGNTKYISSNIVESRIQSKLEYFEFEEAVQIASEIIHQAAKDRNWIPMEFKKYFPEIATPWYRMYKRFIFNFTDDKSVTNPYKQVEYIETIEDLHRWFFEYTHNIEVLIKEKLKSSKVRTEIELAKKHVEDNYNKDININDIAGMVGFNSSYFSHLFKKEVGEGFSDYLSRVRLSRALALLRETTYSINQISDMVGYNDVAYFRKQFRQYHHKSPSECRNKI